MIDRESALRATMSDSALQATVNGHELRPWMVLVGGVCVAKTKCKRCGKVVSCHVNDEGAQHVVGPAVQTLCGNVAA